MSKANLSAGGSPAAAEAGYGTLVTSRLGPTSAFAAPETQPLLADGSDLHAPPSGSAVAHTGSDASAVFHVVCVMAGTGILQLPYCIKQGGWLSLIWIVVAAVVSNYTGILLIRSLYTQLGVRHSSFSDVAGAAFGHRGRVLTRIFKDVSSIGTCTLFLILAGFNLNTLVTPEAGLVGVRYWIIGCAALITVPYVVMRTIQDAVIMSVFGAATTGMMVVIILGLGVLDLPNRPSHDYVLVDVAGFPVALSAICFSFGGNVVWPQVEHGLRDRRTWPRVLTTATTIVSVMYLMVATLGYLVYDAESASPIFLNLPPGAALTVANLMVTVHVLLTTPIMMSSVSTEFEAEYHAQYFATGEITPPASLGSTGDLGLGLGSVAKSSAQLWWDDLLFRALIRIPLMTLTMLCAIFVPFFADVMSLLGSLIYAMLIFVFPVVIYGRLTGWAAFRHTWTRWANWLIIVIGVVCCVVGTYEAILALIRDFQTSL
ncbi:hypothetical protein IWQ60_000959 [Tieghemiomyces parasiticus]|uniref:Amino acid transporter transmembrane domain-containing protein n=1 Tax=Tieghemiomyces parasiticus TaxID=78921 RepID=A0A9W8E2A5_9FUNG|nr:hypothetical protein IWQ60_000959 [Tieghemiomyces parasiticus]